MSIGATLHDARAAALPPPAPRAARPRRELPAWIVPLLVVIVGGAYTYWRLHRGLLPHDDGSIGHAAERVLRGELPHRDFDDVYTGGLAWLNAWGFRALGTSLWTMRVVLFAAFLAWLPAVYYVAARFVRPVAAAAVTLLCVVWSVPNYPAPMPSWYNLFLATAGVAALMRFVEVGHARWLVAAGIAGGLSILVKVVGLYYVAGVLLFLVFHAHGASRAAAGDQPVRAQGYVVVVMTALGVFVVLLAGLVQRLPLPAEVVHFVVPGAAIAALLVRNETERPAGPHGARFLALLRVVAPFMLGVALPVLLFLVPYLRSDSVGALVQGVFVLPARRFSTATSPAPPLWTMLAALPFAAAVLGARRWPAWVRPWTVAVAGVALALVVAVAGDSRSLYRFPWYAVRSLVPLLVLVAVTALWRDDSDGEDPVQHLRRSRLVLLAAVTALCSLVQFPFAAPIYFCYVAPLAFLLATALHAELRLSRPVSALLLAFCAAFAVVRVNRSGLYGMGKRPFTYQPTLPLPLARAGVDVIAYQHRVYVSIDSLLRAHARGGYVWASPDCPEVYFLTGLRNPTRSLFEFFDDSVGTHARVLRAIEAKGVTAIVLNPTPEFSQPVAPELLATLAQRFPSSAQAGHFQVRWR